jgi:hypothetical protein
VPSSQPTPDHVGSVELNTSFKNLGRSPANRVTALSRAAYIVNQPDESVERLFNETRSKAVAVQMSSAMAPGDERFMTTVDPAHLSAQDVAQIEAHQAGLVVLGVILYDDIFNSAHETDFCVFFEGPSAAAHFCAVHNVMK